MPRTSAGRSGSADDHHAAGEHTRISPQEQVGELAVRFGARRTVRRAPAEPGDWLAVARLAAERHRPGTTTLVTLNTVAAAQEVHRRLAGAGVTSTLLHPRLRGTERAARLADIAVPGADLIVVTAEVAEGLDLSAAVLVTEAAAWPALVKRAGRGNRDGTVADAELWWLPPAGASEKSAGENSAVEDRADDDRADDDRADDDRAAACAALGMLEGSAVTSEDLAGWAVPARARRAATMSADEFAALFDTTAAADVAPYLLDGDDLDAELAWATWTPGPDGAPDPEVRHPPAEYRCRVPIGDVLRLAAERPVWRFDRSAGQWKPLGEDPATRPQPLELLLVNAADGGYDTEAGFDPQAPGPVPDSPELLTADELAERAAADMLRPWQSLAEHSDQVRDQAAALLAVLAPRIPANAARATIVAAHLHDAGKAHPVWQDALCALAGESEAAAVKAGRPWAKSGKHGRLEFASGAGFRHELASLLLLDGPLAGLLAASPDPDLTRYLVLAHHGLLRVQIRDPLVASIPSVPSLPTAFGLAHGTRTPIPAIFGAPATTLVTDLAQFGLDAPEPDGSEPDGSGPDGSGPDGSEPDGSGPDGSGPGIRAWQQTVTRLLARYGPFTLAYLETIVRIADWRASGGKDLPESGNAGGSGCIG